MQAQEATPSWARVPAFVDRWRATLSTSPLLDRSSAAPTWAGLAIVGIGFAVLAYGWGRVAGLSATALQIPYLISAGCSGLGLVIVGAAVVAVQAKRREAAARAEVLEEIARVVRELERLAVTRDGTRS